MRATRKPFGPGTTACHYDQFILKGILCGFNPKKVNDWIILDDKPGYRFSSLFRNFPLINYDVMPNPPISLKALEAFMGHSIKETTVPFDIDRPLTEAELAETGQILPAMMWKKLWKYGFAILRNSTPQCSL